ncbi:hypothetical protein GQ42DRAFT_22669 [Ramicandelaber brevisporus]|nr:hypothetical protein GQ42DRAFT_22669 [Ramicandelaber brevisporus]
MRHRHLYKFKIQTQWGATIHIALNHCQYTAEKRDASSCFGCGIRPRVCACVLIVTTPAIQKHTVYQKLGGFGIGLVLGLGSSYLHRGEGTLEHVLLCCCISSFLSLEMSMSWLFAKKVNQHRPLCQLDTFFYCYCQRNDQQRCSRKDCASCHSSSSSSSSSSSGRREDTGGRREAVE